jgi:hypothetical protein
MSDSQIEAVSPNGVGDEVEILELRGKHVVLDDQVARIYEVSTKRLNEQVRRNQERFPSDFSFKLTKEEFALLRSQNATSRWGGRRYPPRAFTEHGAVMLGSVIKSPQAIAASIQVVRAFVHLHRMALSHQELTRKIEELENRYDRQFSVVFAAIKRLIKPDTQSSDRHIGFDR